ncbi:hypothetical protein DIPPA_57781 [Diplonema papillatum]|nr:hypothetical protein DIPPA_57781 [Diplonema papillatum]
MRQYFAALAVFFSIAGATTYTTCPAGGTCMCKVSDCKFTCDEDPQMCADSSLICDDVSTTCNFQCNVSGACSAAHSVCLGKSCSFQCTGESSCAAATGRSSTSSSVPQGQGHGLYCGSAADDCVFRCSGKSSCAESTAYCEGVACSTVCKAEDSCRSLTTTVVKSRYTLDCIAVSACQNAVVSAEAAGDIRIDCEKPNSCRNAVITCPANHDCIINCAEQACPNLSVVCPENPTSRCLLNCFGHDACADIEEVNIRGNLTSACQYKDSCADAVLCRSCKRPKEDDTEDEKEKCENWETTSLAPAYVPTLWCSAVCDELPQESGCIQYCICKAASSCAWRANAAGIVAGYSDPLCHSWCAVAPDMLCWGPNSTNAKNSSTMCECTDGASAAPFDLACSDDDTCRCPDGKDCSILCDAKEECEDSEMFCSDQSCAIACTGEKACRKAEVSGSDVTGDFVVECSGYEACEDMKGISIAAGQTPDEPKDCSDKSSKTISAGVYCGPNVVSCRIACLSEDTCKDSNFACEANSCVIECSESGACKDVEHRCDGSQCKATCSAYESCHDAVFDWKRAKGAVHLECIDVLSCKDVSIECPHGSSCVVTCSGDYSCEDLQLICPPVLAAGQVCRIDCIGTHSCDKIDDDKICGQASATCTGYEACGSDLRDLIAVDGSSDNCVWQTTDFGTFKGYTDAQCSTECLKNSNSEDCLAYCHCMPSGSTTGGCQSWMPSSYSQASRELCNDYCSDPVTTQICDAQCECDLSAVPCSQNTACGCPRDARCTFVCDTWEECRDSALSCENGECYVLCSAKQSCYESTIQCEENSLTCNIDCSGLQSCAMSSASGAAKLSRLLSDDDDAGGSSSYDCDIEPNVLAIPPSVHCTGSQTKCTVACSGTESCQYRYMQCESNACETYCSGVSSCQGATNECTGSCAASCTSYRSCADTAFHWSHSATRAELLCSEKESCKDAVIHCPDEGCLVRCTGYMSCSGISIVCPSTLVAGALCTIACSGHESCSNVDDKDLCGAVSPICTGSDACSNDLEDMTSPAGCQAWEPLPNARLFWWTVSAWYCTFLCSSNPDHAQCRVGSSQMCQCSAYGANVPPSGPVTSTPALNDCHMLNSSHGIECDMLCADPLTNILCSAVPRVQQLCECAGASIIPTPVPSDPIVPCLWSLLQPANAGLVDCPAICSLDATSAACSGPGRLCECTVCQSFQLTPAFSGMAATVDCQVLCTSSKQPDTAECSQKCECGQSQTLAPVIVDVTVVKLFRVHMLVPFWFFVLHINGRFATAVIGMLSLHGIYPFQSTLRWLCPAVSCPNGVCPYTQPAKLAAGCTAIGYVSARHQTVLDDSSGGVYVDVEFDLGDGDVTQDNVNQALQAEIAAGASSSLAEFNISGATQVESEIIRPAASGGGGTAGTGHLPLWALGLLIAGSLMSLGFVFLLVWKRRKPGSKSLPDENAIEVAPTVSKADVCA